MRIYVLDVPCEDCGARGGEECVNPNGTPLSRCYSGFLRDDGPVMYTWFNERTNETVHSSGRPTTYHPARRALFKHTRALAELGAHARA